MKKVGVVLLGISLIIFGAIMGVVYGIVAAEEATRERISLYHGHGKEDQ